jgi:hypothetical protein
MISTGNEDQLHSENKNQGLINTIVNHNDKIKNIENKFNLIVNNYANSSHVKEIVEKTKVLENHVFGAPRPHSSWREFLLTVIMIGALSGILIAVGKFLVGPWLVKYIRRKSNESQSRVTTVREHLPQGEHDNISTINELKTYLEQQLNQQNTKFDDMLHHWDVRLSNVKDPV